MQIYASIRDLWYETKWAADSGCLDAFWIRWWKHLWGWSLLSTRAPCCTSDAARLRPVTQDWASACLTRGDSQLVSPHELPSVTAGLINYHSFLACLAQHRCSPSWPFTRCQSRNQWDKQQSRPSCRHIRYDKVSCGWSTFNFQPWLV